MIRSGARTLAEHSVRGTIAFDIPFMALVVVHCFLSNRHAKNERKWRNICDKKSNLERRNKLAQCDKQKVQVEKELELLI